MAPVRRSPSMISSRKPSSIACGALIGLADRMNSSARSAPMSRGIRWVPPAPGMMPSVTSGKAKRVVGGGNAVVAGQRDLESAAHHGAVHGGNDRKFQRLETVEQRAVFDLARRTAELADIRAGEECACLRTSTRRRECRPRTRISSRASRSPARTSAVMVLTGGW